MEISLKDKKTLVSGSTSGIGKAIAIQFAKLGAELTLLARNEQKLKDTLAILDASNGQKHNFLVADFSKSNELKATLENSKIIQESTFDIVINNTGGPKAGLASEASPKLFSQAFEQHIVCNQLILTAVLPKMKENNFGRILNVISTSVKQPIPRLGVSNTIRGAVASWAKTISKELGEYNITVNNLLPGFTNTQRLESIISTRAEKKNVSMETIAAEMKATVPLKRFAKPEELAYAAAFLCSNFAAYISGVNLAVDGGRIACL